MVRAMVRAMDFGKEGTGIDHRPRTVERQAVRRGEFDVPVFLDSRAPLEVSHPSGGVPAYCGGRGGAGREGATRPAAANGAGG